MKQTKHFQNQSLYNFFFILAAYLSLALIFYFWYYETITAIILAIIGIAFSIYPTARIYVFAKKREKQMIGLYDTVPEAETLFFDDHIFSVGITSKEELNIKYDKIKKSKAEQKSLSAGAWQKISYYG